MEQLTLGDEPAAARPDGPPLVAGYDIERDLAAGAGRVAGVDEVGRGAWAGPVTVCAVIVRPGLPAPPAGLTDSKRLSPQRRAAMAALGHQEFAFAENAGYPSPVHQRALAALGPTPYHRLSWSDLDDLPQWRHLRQRRPDIEGQLPLL